jgi:hypothetical protein
MKFELNTAGRINNLVCHSVESWCGDIQNGLGFSFGNEGSWVVDFDDFEKLYLMAKAYRDTHVLQTEEEVFGAKAEFDELGEINE